MRRAKTVQARFIEYICDSCTRGVYRVDDEPEVREESSFLKSSTKLWKHCCTNCDSVAYLAAPYPIIEYRDRPFVLASRAGVKGSPILKIGRAK